MLVDRLGRSEPNANPVREPVSLHGHGHQLRRGWLALAESARRVLRPHAHQLRAVEQSDSLLDAQVLVADWRIEYHTYRPHLALGMPPPVGFAEQWRVNRPQRS